MNRDDTRDALDQFLAGVERRAYRIARYSLGGSDEALDVVQEAMFRLCERYAHRPSEQWKPLFYRILANAITDHHRKTARKHARIGGAMPASEPGSEEFEPSAMLEQRELGARLEAEIGRLPEQQRQCFLLRCWEQLSVAETARIMGISIGSVKTHYHRALARLGVLTGG